MPRKKDDSGRKLRENTTVPVGEASANMDDSGNVSASDVGLHTLFHELSRTVISQIESLKGTINEKNSKLQDGLDEIKESLTHSQTDIDDLN